jgi:hypothetical protein
MIEVKWDLDGDGIDQFTAAAAVQRVVDYHRRALAGITCPAHGGEPWITVRGPTVASLGVSVEHCCTALKSRIDARMRQVSRRDEG